MAKLWSLWIGLHLFGAVAFLASSVFVFARPPRRLSDAEIDAVVGRTPLLVGACTPFAGLAQINDLSHRSILSHGPAQGKK